MNKGARNKEIVMIYIKRAVSKRLSGCYILIGNRMCSLNLIRY